MFKHVCILRFLQCCAKIAMVADLTNKQTKNTLMLHLKWKKIGTKIILGTYSVLYHLSFSFIACIFLENSCCICPVCVFRWLGWVQPGRWSFLLPTTSPPSSSMSSGCCSSPATELSRLINWGASGSPRTRKRGDIWCKLYCIWQVLDNFWLLFLMQDNVQRAERLW